MKIKTICGLALLLATGPIAIAQPRKLPPPSLTCNGGGAIVQWGSQFHFDTCHTGFNPFEVILGVGNVGTLTLDWKYDTGGTIYSYPAIVNGTVYFGSDDGNLYALNTSTGALLWKYTTGGRVSTSPAVADGTVYVGSLGDNRVLAVDAGTGVLKWQYPTATYFWSSPTVINGTVYVDGNIAFALDARTGKLRWGYAGHAPTTPPALANGLVYFAASQESSVFALDATTGALRWQNSNYQPQKSLTVADGGVFFQGYANQMVALNAGTGANLWNYSSRFNTTPADFVTANGTVYFGGRDFDLSARLWAAEGSTGHTLWQASLPNDGYPLLVANNVVYAACADHNLYAFNVANGTQVWKFSLGNDTPMTATLADGRLYVGGFNGTLYAFHLPNQK